MSTSDKIVNAARAYRDAYAREHAPGAIPTGDARQLSVELLALCREMVDAGDDAGDADGISHPSPAPNIRATRRPWPDPACYVELCHLQFGDAGPQATVPVSVAAWKALQDGQRVMCARGYQWTAHRTGGRLMFTMAKQDGRPGKTIEQPWYPCIVGKLPVWPIAIEAAEPVTC